MEDANTTPADPNVTEYAKNFNLPNEAVETKGIDQPPQELQSIKNKLYEYRKKQAEIAKQQAENSQPNVAPSPVLTKEEAEKNIKTKEVFDFKTYDETSLVNEQNNQKKPDINNSLLEKNDDNLTPATQQLNTVKEPVAEANNVSIKEENKIFEPIKQIEVQKIVESNNTLSAKQSIPDITDLDKRLKEQTASLPEPPNPNVPEITQKPLENDINSKITSVFNEAKPNEPVDINKNVTTNSVTPVSNNEPVSTPASTNKPANESIVNNQITTNQVVNEPRSTEPIKIEKTEKPEEQPVVSKTQEPKQPEIAKTPVPEIPTPEQPDFAELYTKNLKTIIDNFAASISQTSNPTEASLNSIQTVIEGLARESTSSTKQMSGMINRLCTAVESILRYLPNISSQSSDISVSPQLSQTYKDINTGLIDDTRNDIRKQYGSGIIDMANNRPTMPGFSI